MSVYTKLLFNKKLIKGRQCCNLLNVSYQHTVHNNCIFFTMLTTTDSEETNQSYNNIQSTKLGFDLLIRKDYVNDYIFDTKVYTIDTFYEKDTSNTMINTQNGFLPQFCASPSYNCTNHQWRSHSRAFSIANNIYILWLDARLI